MRRTAAFWLLAALAFAPAASAGTASNPELVDDSGDAASSIPGLGATSVELTKAWVAEESPDAFTFMMDVGGDFEPDPTETLSYGWTMDVAGTSYAFGADILNMGATTTVTPTGVANDASHNGAGLMTIVVPRDAFTDIAPGQRMDNMVVTTEAYVISATIWNHADEGIAEKAYTVGAQADPSMDFDGDGHPDAVEVAQGTDPTDPDDPPAFTPPTFEPNLNETGGTFSLHAPSAYAEAFTTSWDSELRAAEIIFTTTANEGSLFVSIEDPFGEVVNFTADETGIGNATIVSAEPGTWNLTVTAYDFQGDFQLDLFQTEVIPDEEDAPVDSEPEEEAPISKKTPMPAMAPVSLGLAWALRGRRP